METIKNILSYVYAPFQYMGGILGRLVQYVTGAQPRQARVQGGQIDQVGSQQQPSLDQRSVVLQPVNEDVRRRPLGRQQELGGVMERNQFPLSWYDVLTPTTIAELQTLANSSSTLKVKRLDLRGLKVEIESYRVEDRNIWDGRKFSSEGLLSLVHEINKKAPNLKEVNFWYLTGGPLWMEFETVENISIVCLDITGIYNTLGLYKCPFLKKVDIAAADQSNKGSKIGVNKGVEVDIGKGREKIIIERRRILP